jgi:hypothetical protein
MSFSSFVFVFVVVVVVQVAFSGHDALSRYAFS